MDTNQNKDRTYLHSHKHNRSLSHNMRDLQGRPSEPPTLDLGKYSNVNTLIHPQPPPMNTSTFANVPPYPSNAPPEPSIPPNLGVLQPMPSYEPPVDTSRLSKTTHSRPEHSEVPKIPDHMDFGEERLFFTENNMPFSGPNYPPYQGDDLLTRRDKESSLDSLRSDSSSFVLGDRVNRNYVDTELERHIFTYGPYVPSRISQSSVPRPQALVFHEESETLYETTKNFGLIPTFGNHKVIDTGSASPIYMTPTFTELPYYGGTLTDMRLPFGVLVQPFAENLDDTIPELDFLSFMEKRSKGKRDLIRCNNCNAYYNPNMQTKSRGKEKLCNFCHQYFRPSDEQLEAVDKINAHFRDKSPLKKGSVDYVAPKHYYKKEKGPGAISNLLTRASSIGSLKQFTKQESFIYDTFSVAPVPVDSSGNYNAFPTANPVSDFEGTVYPEAPVEEMKHLVVSKETDNLDVKYPTYMFVIETTSQANKSNLKESVLEAIMNALDEVNEEQFNLCVLIFDSALYMFPQVNDQFGVYVANEADENFTPGTPSELFMVVTPDHHKQVKGYLSKILEVKTIKASPNSCANFALNSAIRIMSSEDYYGTVCIFYVTQPDAGIGTDPQMFPKTNFSLSEIQKHFYDFLLQMCYYSGICVDVFLCPSETRIPGDVALQYISQQTGGNVVYLPRFTDKFDYFKIYKDILRLFTVPSGYKCEFKLRGSKYIKVKEVLCGFHNTRAVKNESTLWVPRMGPDLTIGFKLALHDMVDSRNSLYLQCACLYTSTKGVQMLRVHTQTIRVISSVNEVFKNANADAIMNLLSRKLAHTYIRTGKYNREEYIKMMIESLTSYRNICAPSTPKNQLILPDNLKLLPAYLNSLLKYDISGEYGFNFVLKLLGILNASVKNTYFLYTRTYCIHRSVYEKSDLVPENGFKFNLDLVPSASAFIYSDGIYLMDDGYCLLMFVGPHVKLNLLRELFGQDYQFPHSYINSTELFDTPTSMNLMELVETIRLQHKGLPYLPMKIITYTAKNSKYIKTLLLEDESGEEPSYINFLVSIHRSILDNGDRL